MSWFALSFSVPLISALRTISILSPKSYQEYERADVSSYENVVRDVALRILRAESAAGSEYAERIKDMIEDLPQHVTPRNIDSLFATRIRIVKHSSSSLPPVHMAGTDVDGKGIYGKYHIAINPMGKDGSKEREAFDEALPWVVAHEMSHILEDDNLSTRLLKTIASFSTCSLIARFYGCSFPVAVMSSVAAIGVHVITHTLSRHYYENKADVFANRHTTIQEREKAVALFESMQKASSSAETVARLFFHPKHDDRIQNIKQSYDEDLKKIA